MSTLRCVRSLLIAKQALNTVKNRLTSVCIHDVIRHNTTYAQQATSSRRGWAYKTELSHRRIEVGPEEERHPAAYGCWNHDSEVYAFGQRLGENFDEKKLHAAFVQRSYWEAEVQRQEELGLGVDVTIVDNSKLAQNGQAFSSRCIKAYLRFSYPRMFEEGIIAIHDFLMSQSTLLQVATSLGVRDLIQSVTYPPSEEEHVTTLMAVIGALMESNTEHNTQSENMSHDKTHAAKQGEKQAEMFVLDFIIPQLVGRDVTEMWDLPNPMGLLSAMLKSAGRGEPEPRILWASGKNTLMPVYNVGIYVDKKLIGKSPGESAIIAEDMAAREALKNLMNVADSRQPLLLGDRLREVTLDYESVNTSVQQVMSSS
ncbi:39S ribosomal protein L44, mitochondrial-like [Mya arenaria]|uniref:39S ribosomal protein L44, mitochondrial-like n=1 Tax=Mya arenaria TaxID=6604 RepID=UPI0022E2DA86|nr:39S ribosomal protein L44, mitochondrial-like [Mya arenaria]